MSDLDPDPVAPPALTVLRSGPMTTVQDLGRPGHRSRGVPQGGAFDRGAHELANALVGNDPEEATIELTLLGGAFRAEIPLAVALAGAQMPAVRRRGDGPGRRFDPPVAFDLRPGDLLEVGGAASGARAYLAVRGGWRTRRVLGSRSQEQHLRAGDRLPACPGHTPVRWLDGSLTRGIDPDAPIRIVSGPDAGLLRGPFWRGQGFSASGDSNRMGIRLEGPGVAVSGLADRLSIPVAPGAVQVSGGALILLGVACGTMGGYPNVAYVASCDLDRLGQIRPGQAVRFEWIEVAEARRLDRAERLRRDRLRRRIAALVRRG